MIFDKLVSAIWNDVYGGIKGYHTNMSLSRDLLADDIADERLLIIKEYQLKGILPLLDLMVSINCIPVDCKDMAACSKCLDLELGIPLAHFEIPQLLNDYGILAILYIGSPDKQHAFQVYTSPYMYNLYHKYRKRGKAKPYVWIDCTPNENGMYDCWVFNAPLLKRVSVVAIFKDLRLLDTCDCEAGKDDNFSWINNEIKKRVTEKKLRYYRQMSPPNLPNNLAYV